jgi:hypothetical protein
LPDILPLENIAHAIQVALTPVFLLSGIGTLLNVFSTRLGRVADRVDLLSAQLRSATPDEAAFLADQLAILRRRTTLLDVAVILGATGAALTCLAALLLFASPHAPLVQWFLVGAFGLALALAIGAIACFLVETTVSGFGVRATVERREDHARAVGGLPPSEEGRS